MEFPVHFAKFNWRQGWATSLLSRRYGDYIGVGEFFATSTLSERVIYRQGAVEVPLEISETIFYTR
jgi:hypothetical protein